MFPSNRLWWKLAVSYWRARTTNSGSNSLTYGCRNLLDTMLVLYSPLFVLQSQVSNNVVDLFAAMDELGEALFTLFNTSHIITITSKNIGEILQCHDHLVICSNLL